MGCPGKGLQRKTRSGRAACVRAARICSEKPGPRYEGAASYLEARIMVCVRSGPVEIKVMGTHRACSRNAMY